MPDKRLLGVPALALAAVLAGCSPDESSLQRVAQTRLGAPATRDQLVAQQEAARPDAAKPAQPDGGAAAGQAKAADDSIDIPVYPEAKRIVTGALPATTIGMHTAVLTTADPPEKVLAFYSGIFPKSPNADSATATTWKDTEVGGSKGTRITVPDSNGDDGLRIVSVRRDGPSTSITLSRVDPLPRSGAPGAAGSAPATGAALSTRSSVAVPGGSPAGATTGPASGVGAAGNTDARSSGSSGLFVSPRQETERHSFEAPH